VSGTVHLHRVITAPPERVYRAFIDPRALLRWLPPYGFVGEFDSFDAQVGGGYQMSFTNWSTGNTHSFRAEFTELVPNERVRHIDRFDDPNLPGELDVTITLTAVSCGTELTVMQSGIPDMIPLEMCYLGWQESLTQLAKLVEPDIPG
jgi:uncharacterized protein YndB with AHSA1/START domain